MQTVYVVMGGTGQYEDRSAWPVKGYLKKEDAEAHQKAAQEAANAYEKRRRNKYEAKSGVNTYDPEMRMDYNGTHYYLSEVPLAEGGFQPVQAAPKAPRKRAKRS